MLDASSRAVVQGYHGANLHMTCFCYTQSTSLLMHMEVALLLTPSVTFHHDIHECTGPRSDI